MSLFPSQRWQVETVNSMLKRLMGSALRARNYWSQCRETVLRAITLNVMILRRWQVFYSAFPTPLIVRGFGRPPLYSNKKRLYSTGKDTPSPRSSV